MDPFRIEIADSVLVDLKRRLDATRFAPDFANNDWRYGANAAYIRELVEYWRTKYDWRATERRMNAFSHFRTWIDGVPVHFIHERGKGLNPVPIILGHGWPWSFWDMQKVIGPLTDPAAHGGDADDAFDVVVPSLPGYGFSVPLTITGHNTITTADLWVKLMAELGYQRFAAEGGDWSALVTSQLGHKYADKMIGIYLHMIVPLDILSKGPISREEFGPEELGYFERNLSFFTDESGYATLQATKPMTPAIALHDSPAGLLAWMVEKRRTWSDCGGNVERRFSKDDLIDSTMIYWITESFASSARYYYEQRHQPWVPSHNRMPVIEAPTGLGVFKNDMLLPAKQWAERYYNLKRWTVIPSGGHFAPMEEPELLVADIRAFFRDLRAAEPRAR